MPQTAPSPSPSLPSKKTGPLEPAKVDRTPKVKQNVLNALGRPPQLHSIRAINIFDDKYTVTIYVKGRDPKICIPFQSIAHQFTLTVNENGDILKSVPPIVKQYD